MQMGTKNQAFRLTLQQELASRCAKNPNYSLRSFAKFLAISPAALSALLNGKRPVTVKMRNRIGFKLGYSVEQLAQFQAKAHGNSKKSAEPAAPFQQVSLDVFSIISEPYHYALLELLKTHDFQPEPRWLAKRLGLTASEINFAVERLERVGLLAREESGQLIDTSSGFTTDIRDGLTSQAQRRFQTRSLEKAIQAVETQPVELRDNTSVTMAINRADLPKAKAMIKDFRRRLCQELEANPTLDEVYQLTVSFVSLTEPSKGNSP